MASASGNRTMAGGSRAQTASARSHPFTCVSCAIAFRSSELQRTHMRSEWHQYNVKRRLASLPPLTSETFAEKVLEAQADTKAAAAKASYERLCRACQKTYYSENAYQNHLQSQRHKARSAVLEHDAKQAGTEATSVISSTISLGEPLNPKSPANTDSEADFATVMNGFKQVKVSNSGHLGPKTASKVSSPDSSPGDVRRSQTESSTSSVADTQTSTLMPICRCMFCNYDSPNLKLNVEHMSRFHNLFIPEQPYLDNLEGLISYLQAKIGDNHECLFCHKLKSSTAGVQTHMRDTGHCMIAFSTPEEMIEIGQFYDFRSSYSDAGDTDEDEDDEISVDEARPAATAAARAAKLGRRRTTSTSSGAPTSPARAPEDDGWETDSSASSVATAEIGSVPIDPDYHRLAHHRHHLAHADPRPHRSADGFHSHAHGLHHAAFHSDHELLLPTGRTAGHRALARYYRQRLPAAAGPAPRAITAGDGAGEEEEEERGRSGREVVERRRRQGQGAVTRANGGLGMQGVTEAKKREVQAAEKRDARRAQRAEHRYQLGVGQRHNQQKHFRDQLLQ